MSFGGGRIECMPFNLQVEYFKSNSAVQVSVGFMIPTVCLC